MLLEGAHDKHVTSAYMHQLPDATEDGTPSGCLPKAVINGEHACMMVKRQLGNLHTLAHQLCTRCSNK